MKVVNGTTDVITYFVLRDSTNHAPKTDVTVTDIGLYYVIEKAAISAKVDATALSAATDNHTDNYAFNIGQGVYRIDWPDTCFDGGVGTKCILIVVCSGVDTTFLEVELIGTHQTGDSYAIVNGDHGLVSIQDDIDAIKAKTDKLTYTSGNDLDANVQKINDVTLTGNGSTTPWGPA